jgi:glycosyltransferase involved in cell wall biosynthesis
VLTVHSLKPKRSRLHKYTLAKADRVLFNSQYTLSQAETMGYRCAARVVYQGYDDRLFGALPRTDVMRKSLRIPGDALVVTAVGRMIELKGMHVLAAAADRILASRPGAHIVFAGDGPSRAEVESALGATTRKNRVHFSGALRRERVAQLLSESDIYVNPGIVDRNGRAEGLGLTTIEAMASGLAVVGSRAGGIVETITDGVSGVLVPPDDAPALATAVSRLLNDAPLRQRMGEAGRRISRERFTWPALAAEVMQVYGEICRDRDRIEPR